MLFLFCKTAQKRLFSCNFRVYFVYFVPPKMVIFFLFCFLSLFSFCLPFQNSNGFLCFLSINPFLDKTLCGGFFCLSFLSFPFLMFASFFETHFLASPFETHVAFVFGIFCFLLLFLFLFSWCMFLPFCFDVGFIFVMFLFFLFCFQTMKTLFSLKFYCFCHVGFKVVYFFSISCFCFCLFFLCCLFPD